MRVLMLNGSPNERGCTYTALAEVGRALSAQGVDSRILWVGGDPVRGCTACRCCAETDRCVFDDGVNEVIGLMEESDGLIVGSPVHFASPSGAVISFLDRLFFAGDCFAGKPAAAVVSARRAGTTAALDVLNKYFTIARMPVVSSTYWNMVHGQTPADVASDAEGLQTMRNLGRSMAWLLKCIEAGRAAGIPAPEIESGAKTNFIR